MNIFIKILINLVKKIQKKLRRIHEKHIKVFIKHNINNFQQKKTKKKIPQIAYIILLIIFALILLKCLYVFF